MDHGLRSRSEQQLMLSVAAAACIVSFCLAAFHLWDHRDLFDPEGISYLDMADAYLRGDWRTGLNGVWSPMYAWLLAFMMLIFDPPAQWEFTAVHTLNLFIYLIALASFSIFMRELLRANEESEGNGHLADWSWVVFGYSLFTWATIQHIPLHLPEPDLLVSALVYLIFAVLFRIRKGAVTWNESIFLGALLGFGYLAKAIMFPMAFVFITVALILTRRSRAMLVRILVSFLTFFSLSLPYIGALSHVKGYWTYSDAGKLNYAWTINKVKPLIHWQGGESGSGVPVHPTRKIHDSPPLYEFGTPIKATYPPWYDPSYWYEGVKVKVDIQRQLSVLIANAKDFLLFFANSPGPATTNDTHGGNLTYSYESTIGPLLTLFCVIVLVNLGRVSIFQGIAQHWFVIVPIATVLGLYALLHFEGRYIAAYVVVLWMILFRSVAIPDSEETRRIFTAVLVSAALIVTITLAPGTGRAVLHAARYLETGNTGTPFFQSGYTNWTVAKYLHNAGLLAGDPVGLVENGSVGITSHVYWARMARVRVVAEIPKEGAMAFWLSDTAKQTTLMRLFRDVGVRAVVASGVPASVASARWQRIADTDYYVYVFPSNNGNSR